MDMDMRYDSVMKEVFCSLFLFFFWLFRWADGRALIYTDGVFLLWAGREGFVISDSLSFFD
jgi:hypothetical protein